MIASLVLALFWLAALHRTYVAVRSPRPWRVAFATAVTAVAVALTADLHGSWLAQLAPRLDTLVGTCAGAAAACACMIYVQTLRFQDPPRQLLIRTGVGGMLVLCVLVATWVLAPVGRSDDVFGKVAHTHPLAVLHYLVFYIYVAYGAGAAAVYCWRRLLRGRDADSARVLSLALIGSSTALAASVLLCGAASVVATPAVAARLQGIKELLIPVAAAALGGGVLLLLAVSPLVVEILVLHRRWLRLRSLWKRLTAVHPAVALHGRPSWPPREALRMREQRVLVEIHDALARESVPTDVHTLEALGRALRRGERGPVPASSVLPASGDFTADLNTVLQLASAYDAAPR